MSDFPGTFDARKLHVLSYANGWTHWLYLDPQGSMFAIFQPKFFQDSAAKERIAVGDHISVSTSEGGMLLSVRANHLTKGVLI